MASVTVSSLLEQRRRGDISKEQFFKGLAELSESDARPRLLPSPGADVDKLEADPILTPQQANVLVSGRHARPGNHKKRDFSEPSETINPATSSARSLIFQPAPRFNGGSASLTKHAQDHAMELASRDVYDTHIPRDFKFEPRSFINTSSRGGLSEIDRYLGRSAPSISKYEPKLSFHERNRVWMDQKSTRLHDLERSVEEERMRDCSFQPKTSIPKHTPKHVDLASVVQRLSLKSSTKQWEQKRPLVEDEVISRDLAECTFQPDISKSQAVVPSRIADMRLLVPTNESICSSDIPEIRMEDVPTFAPEINQVPLNMTTAQEYLKKNVFQRLSSPPRRRRHLNGASDLLKQDRHESLSSRNSGSVHSFDPADEGFVDFLWRQNEHEFVRLQRLREIEQDMFKSHRPMVRPRSKVIANRIFHGTTFLDRMEQDIGDRSDRKLRSRLENAVPKHLPFQPSINPRSSMMPPRSMAELSLGDLEERRKNAEALRQKLEKFQQQTHTFTPKTKNVQGIQSRVATWTSREDYIDHLRRRTEDAEDSRQLILQEQMENDMKECTFQPRIHGVPKYISRLARSSRIMKETKQKENEKVCKNKPEWRYP